MKIAVWRTGHEIADLVAEAVYEGLKRSGITASLRETETINEIEAYDCHMAYGILRGTSEVFKQAQTKGRVWFNIDRGYFKPSHYDGYYRVSLRGTQQTTGLDKLKPDYERWKRLGLEILPAKEIPKRKSGLFPRKMVCPPTEYVKEFFNCDFVSIFDGTEEVHVREKGTPEPLQKWLDWCDKVKTFNSSIGWEALRQGIPVVSDPQYSIVGAYQKMLDKSIHDDSNERRKLFALMAGMQLRLDEIRGGLLWPLLQTLLTIN